jgi:hypothetical protein
VAYLGIVRWQRARVQVVPHREVHAVVHRLVVHHRTENLRDRDERRGAALPADAVPGDHRGIPGPGQQGRDAGHPGGNRRWHDRRVEECDVGLLGQQIHRHGQKGPAGGRTASRKARRSITGRSWACWTSKVALTAARARPTRSPESIGSCARCRRSCWPAVTTMGVRDRLALSSPDRPFARPAATWRLTNAGRPVARAYPSAIATTDPS